MICFSNEGAWAKTIMQSLDVFIQTSFKLAHNPALSSVFFPQNKPSECLTPHFCHLLCISFNFLLAVSFINVLVSVWLLNSWTELNFEKDLQPVALFLTSQSVILSNHKCKCVYYILYTRPRSASVTAGLARLIHYARTCWIAFVNALLVRHRGRDLRPSLLYIKSKRG